MKTLIIYLICSFSFLFANIDSKNSILDQIKQKEIEVVHFAFTDIHGDLKAISIPQNQVAKTLANGLKFDGSSIAGCSKIQRSDMHLEPDLNTYRTLPEEFGKTGIIFCDVCISENKDFTASPRTILKSVLKSCSDMGYKLFIGPELEFYIFDKNQPVDNDGYLDPSSNFEKEQIKQKIFSFLIESGIILEKIHHEVSPGQYEVVLRYDEALKMADNIVLAKYLIEQAVKDFGYEVSFLPKPIQEINGSGLHMHFSLWDTETNQNLFYESGKNYHLSTTAECFLAGNLYYLQEASCLLNPISNSYLRLVPGFEAPIFLCWGSKNRSACIRIPLVNEKDAPKQTRAELRSPDPSCNPYLAFAFIGASGLKGIKDERSLSIETDLNLYKLHPMEVESLGIFSLPISLDEGLQRLEKSSFASEFFDSVFLQEFIRIKSEES